MKLRIPINTITVIALCIASSKIQVLSSAFIYDRNAIWRGEIWRLVTSHFVHFNSIHLIYNIIAFGIVGWIIESKGNKHFKLLYFVTACSISAVLLAVKPDMVYFGGLSGIACGFFVYCALLCLHEHPPWRFISILSLIFISAKMGCELYSDGSILPYWGSHDFIPVPISHIAGSISALILFLLIKIKKSPQNIFSPEPELMPARQLGGRLT